MTQDIMQRISYIQNDIDSIKEDFANTIKDTSIPLAVRWDLFVEAPDYLKNHESWIMRFDEFDFDVADQDYERHRQIQMNDVIEGMEENEYWEANPEAEELPENYVFSEKISKFKEHILSENLGSFIFDW